MNYSINEIISLIEKELKSQQVVFDARVHLLNMYKENGKIVDAFHEDDKTVLRHSIGSLFLSLILLAKQYDIDCYSLVWDDEGIDIDVGHAGFYKDLILLNVQIGNLSSGIYSIQYANINLEMEYIPEYIEGVLEKLSNIACSRSIDLNEAAYLAYEKWKENL